MSKTYLISGAGSGIGRAIAQQLADDGHQCILLGRNADNLNDTLISLDRAHHQMLIADIRDKQQLADAAQQIADLTLDGIIANSGIGGENQWGKADRWNEIVDTNLTGTYNFVNTFLPLLQASTSAERHILITSSVLARLGVANYSAYCASKAGLLGLMRSWAVQYAPDDILVNAICPGWVDTEMSEQGMQGIADGLGISKKEFYDMAMQSVPLRRMSQPKEIAGLVAYLLGQRAMTGQAIDMNGGAVMNS
ncbi:NAD(P)-dependent dehydrogenase (short-subunit alcohol dehydrogenase family) [Mucilaginibacter yixingensis]|uniref:NAD(P)-dependent dehydrogenase (Short-subunit alcohol dehydrogenase family) n=1 Tax=Mucilaginibacter yixingensis TaxID=1295612 RepID=A0A2T5J810_9SPHI|nr:SDR family NAD(P)-dependent oxidoreductase [Mucilaginibacter yixingensis]PTQ95590.1 NAD(P)-dependent dehydrogenase (short-subunit alcohol dehydrogenase family) [Mucilaginibacter yixingensis]